MKTPKLTPWQKWAQDYQSKIPTFLRLESEYADEYSRAAWKECKKRCLEILKKHEGHGCRDTWTRKEMEAL